MIRSVTVETRGRALAMATAIPAAAALALAIAPVTASADQSGPQGARGVTLVEPGVHSIGRADAPLTLTEYVSYTCPHCAHFETEAGDTLALAYAGAGKVRVEYRHAIRDPLDLTAALLSNCGKIGRFPGNHAAIMRAQSEWMGKVRAATTAQRARYSAGTVASRLQAMGRDSGLYDLMEKRGYSTTDLDRCTGDEKLARTLSEKAQGYFANGVNGTPSFAINGTMLAGTHDWSTLKPQIDIRLEKK